jgi:hypothetical protein
MFYVPRGEFSLNHIVHVSAVTLYDFLRHAVTSNLHQITGDADRYCHSTDGISFSKRP